MKKIVDIIGKGIKKLKTTKKFKAIITVLLVCVMLIDLNPFFLKAGKETLVYTFNNGVQIPFAFDNNHNSYSYYSISKMGGHIAYCLDYDVKNPPNNTGLQYARNISSKKILAVLMNGYPAKSAAQLGLSNNQEAYLATQMAVWGVANGTSDTKGLYFDINKLQPNLKYRADTDTLLNNSKKVAKQLLNKSYAEPKFSLDNSNVKVNYDYSDKKLRIGPYKAKISGYSSIGKVKVELSGQPEGTTIVDKDGNKKSNFDKNENIYILVNKSEPAASLTITATGKANEYIGAVYESGSWQNFVFLDTEQRDVKDTSTAAWEESKGNIKVVKADQDGKAIKNAEFTLTDDTGKTVGSGKTNENGVLKFTKLPLGKYTLTETSVPDGYIIQKTNYNATVRRNETTTVNVQNTKVKGVLQITKLERKSNEPIKGAVFEIYNSNGKVVEKITTNKNGIATSSELPKGAYTYKEVSVPDGYIMEADTRAFSITETINAVRETVTNVKIVGNLKLLKISDDGEKPLEGAEFTIYDQDKKEVTTLVTDAEGEAISVDLAKGTYILKETKAPYGYDADPNEYKFKIESLDQRVEKTITNNRIYGKLKIQKVDESDKAIENVKFQIINSENKVITSVKTDVNGIATVENLPVGKYKYKEVDTPYLYVLDEKEYDFEIVSEQREVNVKVVNERAKGILKIVKIDKDSKVAIANAKFNIIDKTNNDIVDAIVTDENGVARTKALPTGEYYYQEVEVPDEYIIDTKTYEVKIKKNNQMVDETVSNEHKKLPVTGGFLSTDVTIILIVTSTSVIAYMIYKIIKYKKDNPYNPDDDFYIPQSPDPNDDNNYISNVNLENVTVLTETNEDVSDSANFEANNEIEIELEEKDNNEISSNQVNHSINIDAPNVERSEIEKSFEEQTNNIELNVKNEEAINIDDSNDNKEYIEDDSEIDIQFLDDEDEMLDLTPKYNDDENEDFNK